MMKSQDLPVPKILIYDSLTYSIQIKRIARCQFLIIYLKGLAKDKDQTIYLNIKTTHSLLKVPTSKLSTD